MTRRIGILTSGGDCGGLNAAIRAVAPRAHHGYGWTTIGQRNGTLGLVQRPVAAETLDPDRLDAALSSAASTAAIPSPFRCRTAAGRIVPARWWKGCTR